MKPVLLEKDKVCGGLMPDIATFAGMEPAEAMLSGNRSHFDRPVDPAKLQIRSESKRLSFQIPTVSDCRALDVRLTPLI